MPDTHDERGGNETPLARVQAFQRAANPNGDYHWPAEEAANVNGVPLYFDDIESLTAADNFDAVDAVVARWRKAEEHLAAATARAEKAEAERGYGAEANAMLRKANAKLRAERDEARARLAELGKPEVEQRLISPNGLVYEPTLRDLENQAYWLLGVRLEERQVYPTPWRVAADAAQDGLSGPVERSETSGGAFHGNTSSITPQGLSEAEGGCPWCGTLQKLDADGLVLSHEHPTYCDECPGATRRPNDTTEDGQHG